MKKRANKVCAFLVGGSALLACNNSEESSFLEDLIDMANDVIEQVDDSLYNYVTPENSAYSGHYGSYANAVYVSLGPENADFRDILGPPEEGRSITFGPIGQIYLQFDSPLINSLYIYGKVNGCIDICVFEATPIIKAGLLDFEIPFVKGERLNCRTSCNDNGTLFEFPRPVKTRAVCVDWARGFGYTMPSYEIKGFRAD